MKTTRKPKVPLNQATRNRLLDEAVDDYAIHTLDSAGRIASWSAGAARLFGHDASEILGRDYACFHTRKDRDAGVPQQALRQADAEGRFETEGWRVRSNGKRFWAQVVIDAIRDSQGQLLGFAQLIHDLSEGRAAKEALRRSQEQFRLLVQSVTDYAIYMLDHRGRITNWNLGAQRIKGYLPEEVIGRHFSCFYTPEDREAGEPARGLAAAEREGRFEKEGWRVRKDGSRFWANVVIDPIRDSDGRLIGFAKVTRDITHRIEAERELERARQELFQAQKMESLGHLTGGVAHDFNNLLTVIIGSLGLLKKRLPGDQRTADLLQNALEAAQRGANLTQRMLSFARKQRLDPQPCAIPDLLRGMTDLLIHSLGPSVSIETRFPLDLDLGLTDANQLELSIINLATNARDAMPNGGRIVFSASNQRVPADNPHRLAPGNYICLSISDTGSGMDEENPAPCGGTLLHHQGNWAWHRAGPVDRRRPRRAARRPAHPGEPAGRRHHREHLDTRRPANPGKRPYGQWRDAAAAQRKRAGALVLSSTGGGRRPAGVEQHRGDAGGPRLLGTQGRLRQPGPGDSHGDAGAGHPPDRPGDATDERQPVGGAGHGPGPAAEDGPGHRLRGKDRRRGGTVAQAGQAVRPGRVVPVPDRHAEGRLSLSAGTRRCRPGFAPRAR